MVEGGKFTVYQNMSGSCHLDRASNFKLVLNVKYLLFSSFSTVAEFVAHSRYYKDALTQIRSFLVICATSSFDFHVG